MLRFRKRLHAWLAIVAMLVAALAPAVSRAMVDAEGQFLIDICSAGGTHRFAIPAADAGLYLDAALAEGDDSDGSLLESLSACPYCGSHAAGVGLPPMERTALLVAGGVSERLPLLFLVAPRPLFAWSPSSPRAPPPFV
ncbi:DUF2946 domain-containing protein [Thauera linaloolentis]|uniref:DUF2946 domain-containing protein n=1 Tax=Thauera linaloolentis TaxID=76112 RepID=UPI00048E419E|nr:DUF2946 domain-containing protein [Thauera linaloolentis]MCM8566404.1 DUF2946 domain-containing protein [Thauera linaloolentis]